MAQESTAVSMPIPRKLWQHPDPKSTNMWRFMQKVNAKRGMDLKTFRDLYAWSVGDKRVEFWEDWWESAGLIFEGEYEQVVDPHAPMDTIPHWFKGTRLNFAENVLLSPSPSSPSTTCTLDKEDSKIALTEIREGNTEIRHMTYGELRRKVALLANALRAKGVKKGDRVAVVASNSFDTYICFMAITSLGGLFSSSSTDMGTKGVLDRLLQIKPVYVLIDDWTVYNGKTLDLRPKIREIVEGLKDVQEFRGAVIQPRFPGKPADLQGVPRSVTLESFIQEGNPTGNDRLVFERVEFRDPFLVVYSSGTTGVPKCIVHSVGGVLISSMKEGKLHRGMGRSTVQLQYTTTGWIMYLVASQVLLYSGRAVLYDGSPFMPKITTFMEIVAEQKVTDLGTSPRYLSTLATSHITPRALFNLSSLRTVSSTGMVLSDALFEWFYDTAFPPSVQLANISGGTDLAGCFGMENPLDPVYVGGCQGFALGTRVEVFDAGVGDGEVGRRVRDGVPGELVATASFPNQPVSFYSDPTGRKYHSAYYARFPRVWTHGDFIQIHPVTKQIFFLGRADGVLNPSGVRFGSSDIYSVIEEHFPEVAESLCVGQRRPQDADESVLLFIMMKEGERYSDNLVERINAKIGEMRSKRHIPKYVFETLAIPTTVNLKKVELPVKQIVSGRVIKPSGTLLNPESLNFYYQFAKVEEVVQRMERDKSLQIKSKL
ncbi:acetoacetyl-CoA synthase [Delitschia confertaspora ATCC 74209]|uniref:Acetoacetyl-CoA synthase n=1 Tax=Delitschia confertaspora ATCC 74209 TaxID=1513339 RepID=A0A9P4MWY2_9PLEO|nr:acetoacetyl-CoA synthase [Delitschia confertaspora ATCC 74209]